ncbi:MAG: response regulator [Chloroflexia bacterium]
MKQPPTLLVIEDDKSTRTLIVQALKDEGYNIVGAANGEEGWYELLRVRPRLILLDLQMPLMTGWGFVQKMEQEGIPVPIIIMSGMIDSKADALELGAVDMIRKPFTIDDLRSKVAKHLR